MRSDTPGQAAPLLLLGLLVLCAVPAASSATPSGTDHALLETELPPPEIAEAQPAAPQAWDAAPTLPNLSVGDKLSIKIYERPDLSGEMSVRGDGTITLPLIGVFKVAGRQLPEIEQDVSAALEKATGRVSALAIDVAEWRPIFVVGAVERPGTYPFKLSMTGLHALAAAGGPYRLSSANRLEASREMLLHRQNLDKLKSALARRGRIAAELENKTEIEMPPRLAEITSAADAEAAIGAEERILKGRKVALDEAIVAADRKIVLTKKEIEVLNEQLTQERSQVELARSEANDSKGLAEKGLTSRTRLFEVQRLLSSYEVAVREVLASLARAEQTLSAAEKERSGLDVDRHIKLEEELMAVEEEVRSLETALRSSSETTGLALRDSGSAIEQLLTYEIVRREGNAQATIAADENTELQPGDVVRILVSR